MTVQTDEEDDRPDNGDRDVLVVWETVTDPSPRIPGPTEFARRMRRWCYIERARHACAHQPRYGRCRRPALDGSDFCALHAAAPDPGPPEPPTDALVDPYVD